MRSIPKYILVFAVAFAVGTIATLGWKAVNTLGKTVEPATETISPEYILYTEPVSQTTVDHEEEEEPENPLDDVWMDEGSVTYKGFEITKECVPSGLAKITIAK